MFRTRTQPPYRGIGWGLPLASTLGLVLACGGSHLTPLPAISRFEVQPREVEVGEKVTLKAEYANGEGTLLGPRSTPLKSGGSLELDPMETPTFTLYVVNAKGENARATATVHVKPGLLVNVKGLPQGIQAPVTVKGDGGFTKTLTATQPLTGLAKGTYTVEAGDIQAANGGPAYHPLQPKQTVKIEDSGVSVTVLYPSPTVTVDLPGDEGLEFVLIPAGTFTMGAEASDGLSHDFQNPHPVTIGKAFYMAKYLTTQGQWKAVMKTLPRMPDLPSWRNDPAMPVSTVSWEEAHDGFIPKLAALSPGHPFRLPSEAEWEYALRAGSSTHYPWGITFDAASDHLQFVQEKGDPNVPPPMPGAKPANPWGLFDMQGMLLQWVEDTYQPSYAGAPQDGKAWVVNGFLKERCARGTTFNSTHFKTSSPDDDYWASASRFAKAPGSKHTDFGFRLAMSVSEQ